MITLLDVDADFMLNRDYNWSWSGPHARSKSKIVISGKTLGRVLKPFLKEDTEIILETDHHESLYWWDCYDVHDALCIHIDAHHDMWSNDGVAPGIRDRVDCGNYLQQALCDKIVRKVVFVPSPFKDARFERADILDNLGRRVKPDRLHVSRWKVFKKHVFDYPRADIITISISPEWFPSKHWYQVEDLAKILGVKNNALQQAEDKAFQKWQGMNTGRPTHWGDNDFQFPYFGLKSTTLKQLRESLRLKKVKK